jgi:hypothetical protein
MALRVLWKGQPLSCYHPSPKRDHCPHALACRATQEWKTQLSTKWQQETRSRREDAPSPTTTARHKISPKWTQDDQIKRTKAPRRHPWKGTRPKHCRCLVWHIGPMFSHVAKVAGYKSMKMPPGRSRSLLSPAPTSLGKDFAWETNSYNKALLSHTSNAPRLRRCQVKRIQGRCHLDLGHRSSHSGTLWTLAILHAGNLDILTVEETSQHLHNTTCCKGSAMPTDVYARVCSCRQCWASKCRGL